MIMTYMLNMMMMMISALTAMAFYTLSERKFIGYMQYRKGPNKPNMMALAIPMADAAKLFSKEQNNTMTSNQMHYLITPTIMIIFALLLWPIFPHYNSSYMMKFSILYFLCITGVSIYTTFMAGWSSNSSWGMLGALRGVAQTISYEVSMALILISFMLYPLMINLSNILQKQYSWLLLMMMPLSLSWIISILAETHRTPFDFTEGESELVSGFNIEYSSSLFALIFMAEYMNILFMSLLSMSIMTSNYSNTELIMKTTMMSILFIWFRSSLPRLRYDSLMVILWKKILPLSLMLMLLNITMMLLMK
uniref:NADH-ubiquinone oxidoreductase chain 1 n=1 Tax=Olavius algarvensis TaxID=188229 RepID=A0A7R9NG87_9ANNE|nr:ND1 CDS [Olavius algarvensis]CAD7857586.1 ND1 CDS [Olavius algarvensis]